MHVQWASAEARHAVLDSLLADQDALEVLGAIIDLPGKDVSQAQRRAWESALQGACESCGATTPLSELWPDEDNGPQVCPSCQTKLAPCQQ